MRKIFWLVVVIVILTSTAAWAAEAVKIGFIDLQSALLESDAGKKAKADLAALEKSKKAVIDEKVKSIKNLEEEISKQSSVLSAEAKKVKEDELEREQRDFQRQVQDARAELQKKENELTEAILKDM
ncbi:MAG: OmpH family outer membrane protein, partial [Nitrospirae bacterium]|nr:OmpH family outer membrane protein [Nitrospirota bacterium]